MDIIQKILENGGITLDTALNEVQPTTGFAVGGYLPEVQIPVQDLNMGCIEQYLGQNDVSDVPYVGLWVSDGVVYFDGVKIFDDKDVAIAEAQRLNQLAIWDFGTSSEIRVKDN